MFPALSFFALVIPVLSVDLGGYNDEENCGKEWFSHGSMCYRLSSAQLGAEVSWQKASDVCKNKFGGKLASIHSNELQDFLTQSLTLIVVHNVWIGMHERVNETGYAWEDGSAVDYTNWGLQEPSGFNNRIMDCVEMDFTSWDARVGQWNAVDCDSKRMFLCQRDKDDMLPGFDVNGHLSTSIPVNRFEDISQKVTQNPTSILTTFQPDSEAYTTCEKGWYSFGDKCYKLGGFGRFTEVTWNKASKLCREDYDGSLVTIDSQELQDFLSAYFLLEIQGNLWIGMNDQVQESSYVWDDGSPVNYTNWEPEEPSGLADQKEDCVEMVFMSGRENGRTGQWNDIDCKVKRMFICQKDKGSAFQKHLDPRFCSPSGGLKFGKSCYHIFHQKKTWYDAEEFCSQTLGGHLATILDYTTNLFLNYLVRNEKGQLWIGIKLNDGVQQKWSSGWIAGYENWIPHKEWFLDSDQRCTVLVTFSDEWSLQTCSSEQHFICEQTSAKPPSLPPAPEGSVCPNAADNLYGYYLLYGPPKETAWRDLGGQNCYYFETKRSVSWPMADFLCKRKGGNLASIHSEEELNVIQNFVRYKHFAVHIGLYRSMANVTLFEWSDGSPVDFTNFDVGEPSSLPEICVELRTYNMRWNDINCDAERGYICSVPKIFPKYRGV